MGIIVFKKKKERTPEQIRRRFHMAVGLIIVMLVFIMYAKVKTRHDEPPKDETEAFMDSKIDSLAAGIIPGAKVERTGRVIMSENSTAETRELEAERIYLEAKLELKRSGVGLAIAKESEAELETRIAEIDGKLAAARRTAGRRLARGVIITSGDTVTISATQAADTALTMSWIENYNRITPEPETEPGTNQ